MHISLWALSAAQSSSVIFPLAIYPILSMNFVAVFSRFLRSVKPVNILALQNKYILYDRGDPF